MSHSVSDIFKMLAITPCLKKTTLTLSRCTL